MAKIDLKRCPFCGGTANLILANIGYSSHPTRILNAYYVKCVKCGTKTEQYASDIRQEDDGDVVIKANGAELAAEMWNKRADPPSCYRPSITIEARADLDPTIQNKVNEILDSITELAHMLKQKREEKNEQ